MCSVDFSSFMMDNNDTTVDAEYEKRLVKQDRKREKTKESKSAKRKGNNKPHWKQHKKHRK
jgi:hypothetical protein